MCLNLYEGPTETYEGVKLGGKFKGPETWQGVLGSCQELPEMAS